MGYRLFFCVLNPGHRRLLGYLLKSRNVNKFKTKQIQWKNINQNSNPSWHKQPVYRCRWSGLYISSLLKQATTKKPTSDVVIIDEVSCKISRFESIICGMEHQSVKNVCGLTIIHHKNVYNITNIRHKNVFLFAQLKKKVYLCGGFYGKVSHVTDFRKNKSTIRNQQI